MELSEYRQYPQTSCLIALLHDLSVSYACKSETEYPYKYPLLNLQ